MTQYFCSECNSEVKPKEEQTFTCPNHGPRSYDKVTTILNLATQVEFDLTENPGSDKYGVQQAVDQNLKPKKIQSQSQNQVIATVLSTFVRSQSPKHVKYASPRVLLASIPEIVGEDIYYGTNDYDYDAQDILCRILNRIKVYDTEHFPPWTEEQLLQLQGSPVSLELVGKEQLCALCFKLFKEFDSVIELTCGHILHLDCITIWRRRIGGCSGCRLRLPVELTGNLSQVGRKPRGYRIHSRFEGEEECVGVPCVQS